MRDGGMNDISNCFRNIAGAFLSSCGKLRQIIQAIRPQVCQSFFLLIDRSELLNIIDL